MSGIKGEALRPCDICKSPVAGNTRGGRTIDFHVVVIERHLLDPGAMSRHAGLAMMLGSDALAGVMGPNEDFTKLFDKREVFVCGACWTERHLYDLSEEGRGRDLPIPEARR